MVQKKTRRDEHSLTFTIPIYEPLPPQYYIKIASDRWLGNDLTVPLSFKHLLLPEEYPPHTALLDLHPIPVSALHNPQAQQMFKYTHFNPVQTQAFHTVYHTDENILLGAPTGSGKTAIAELAMLRLFAMYSNMKVVYVAPMKALAREKMVDWNKPHSLKGLLGKTVIELTGDTTPDMQTLKRADVLITTPEKWDGVSRGWKSRGYVQSVGLVIIDEIHLLGQDRGPILEVIVSRMRYISTQTENKIRIVGLSTALANARDLGDWLGIEGPGLFNFHPVVRPVPLETHIMGFPGRHYCPRMATMNKPCYAAITTHSPNKPVLVFVSSRRQTRLTALDLIGFSSMDGNPRKFLNMDDDALEYAISSVRDKDLKHMLSFGIGMHHAGLPPRDRVV
jgi:activating signal cointegrator complex subunit 3